MFMSKIDRDIGLGLRTADQHIVGHWRVDGVELIIDGAGYEGGITFVADTGTA